MVGVVCLISRHRHYNDITSVWLAGRKVVGRRLNGKRVVLCRGETRQEAAYVLGEIRKAFLQAVRKSKALQRRKRKRDRLRVYWREAPVWLGSRGCDIGYAVWDVLCVLFGWVAMVMLSALLTVAIMIIFGAVLLLLGM